ncbi:Gfo/Idh/MocA family protein [Paenibacillus sp. MBLB4367]|uniref:Gfo/Idh/MocA family protein n=1 Tax=Paenibacillus sp. MBLB4367 TaxID=3384767 RepID=UPI0039081213
MKTVKIGIIGLGSWGESHLEAFRSLPQAEVAAVCDTREDRLNELADKYGVPHRYTQYEKLLERTDLDLVSVVTFEKHHLAPVLLALRSGKHVLVEKPVSTNVQEAEEMARTAAENNRFILPGHLLRFDPRYASIHQSLQKGEIGRPLSIHSKRSRQKSLYATYRRTHTVYELMIHDLDLAIWYAGSRVQTVRAYGLGQSPAEAPEILWACLEFANGAMAVLHSNWMTPDEAGIAIADSIEVIGDKGTAHFETSLSGLQIWNASGRQSPDTNIHAKLLNQTVGSLREQVMYICRCLAEGTVPDHLSFEDAVHGVAVADAIVQSCSTGREVRL